jgi:hypothetical protein
MASCKEVTRVHCSICGQISPENAKNFEERMAWLRQHRKEKHPEAFRKSVKKAVETREEKK